MAVFEYAGLTASGKKTRGVVDAETERSARVRLREQGIYPTTITESRANTQQQTNGALLERLLVRPISTNHLAMATRQLSTLVGSGMPLVESLKALAELVDHAGLKRVIAEVTDRVNEGSDLAEAMRPYPNVFSKLYINMISAGQANGRLDLILERLADLLEAQAGLKRKITAALTYPILMLTLCFGVILILLAYVVPEITEIFKDKGAALPLPTEIVITLSDAMKNYWFLVVGAVVLTAYLFIRWINTVAGRERFDRIWLKLPVVGPLALRIATARFARNLGTLLGSEVPILEALRIVKNIVGNTQLEKVIESAAEGVKEGRSLSKELEKGQIFPRMMIHMISAGEQSGEKLSHMLLRGAASYESEVNTLVGALTSVLEPILIVFLAVVVGGILAAVMLPMLEMNQLSLR